LLPVGRLREPMSSLARADAVVLTEESAVAGLRLGRQHIWRVRRQVILPKINGTCVAFCGIAKPEQFFAQLRGAGVSLAATRIFRDHHPYVESDVQALLNLRRSSGATAFVTTEKDAVNLGPRLAAMEPIHVAPLRLELEAADAALNTLLAAIEARRSPSS
jgi:tetraacyldisaccharide 4'-kinase